MTRNPQFHGRAKHLDLKVHFMREKVNAKESDLIYCPTEEMVVDILTKGTTLETLLAKAGLLARQKSME